MIASKGLAMPGLTEWIIFAALAVLIFSKRIGNRL